MELAKPVSVGALPFIPLLAIGRNALPALVGPRKLLAFRRPLRLELLHCVVEIDQRDDAGLRRDACLGEEADGHSDGHVETKPPLAPSVIGLPLACQYEGDSLDRWS